MGVGSRSGDTGIFYAVLGAGVFCAQMGHGRMAGFWGLRLAIYLAFLSRLGKPARGSIHPMRTPNEDAPAVALLISEFQAVLTVVPVAPSCWQPESCRSARPVEKIGAAIGWSVLRRGRGGLPAQSIRKNLETAARTYRRGLWGY